jgi:single-strand DNA-binding protein
MASLNKVFLMGNLTRDPERRTFANGGYVTRFSMATNRRYKHNGEMKEEVTFIDCDVFGSTGDAVAQYCRKGSPVIVEGRLKSEQWEDRQTGQKRSRMKVACESVQFINSAQSRTEYEPEPAPAKQQMPVYQEPLPTSEINHDDIPF